LNKARRGELKIRLPIGFNYDDQDRIVVDPEKQVQESVRHFFPTFGRIGSAYRTVRAFKADGLKFPLQMFHGPRKGEVILTELKVSRVSHILHNPRYIGAYVYERRTQKRQDARERPIVMRLPAKQRHTLIKDFHEGYNIT